MKKLILIFFINLLFSSNLFAVTFSDIAKLPDMDEEEIQILNEIKSYINSENTNKYDGIDSLVGTNEPMKIKILWFDPAKASGLKGDGSYNCPTKIEQYGELYLNEPSYNFKTLGLSTAEKLNGYEWKGVLTIYTDALKLKIDKQEFLNNSKEVENLTCMMSIRGIDSYSVFQNFNFPSEFQSYNKSIDFLSYNNLWVDYSYDQYIYYLHIAKFKNNIFKSNLLLNALSDCNIDDSSEICKLLK